MPKTNRVLFKYFVDLPNGGRRLHASSVSESISHASYEDMTHQIRQLVADRIGIVGTIRVKTSDCGRVVDEKSYDDVVDDGVSLTAQIDDVQAVSIGAFW